MQAPDSMQRVSVFRPVDLQMGPTSQPEVSESALARYRLKIDPLSFDEQRASFQCRAPGLSVVCSSNAFLEVSFKIKAPARWTYQTAVSALFGNVTIQNIEAPGAAGAAEANPVAAYNPKIAFGGGDAFAGALSNVQIVVNGAALSNSRQRTYTNALDRIWFSDSVFQRRFSMCGGAVDSYSGVCLSGTTQAGAKLSGFTADSGVEQRVKNLLACTTGIDVATAPTVQDIRTVRIRWPVRACGILSPISAFDEVADSCPYKNSCLAIPHFNSVSLDFLFVGLKECLFRNLTARLTGGDNAGLLAEGRTKGGFDISIDTSAPPTLHLEYLRLGIWNQIPSSIAISAYKIQVHDPTKTPVVGDPATQDAGVVAALTRANINRVLKPMLPCVGVDRTDGVLSRCAPFNGQQYMECEWQVTSAQVASYLAFVFQKSSDVYVLGGDLGDDSIGKAIVNWNYAAGECGADAMTTQNAALQNYFLSRNTNSSASIQEFQLTVMASVGSYTYSGESYPYLRGRHELFRDILKHTCPNYLNGDMNKWRKYCGIVILSASDFLRGLTSDGTSFPVQYSVKIKFASEREYIAGSGCVGSLAGSTGFGVQRDIIVGSPVMLEIFNKVEMRLSPSSGVISSQNLAHSTAMELISRGGQ